MRPGRWRGSVAFEVVCAALARQRVSPCATVEVVCKALAFNRLISAATKNVLNALRAASAHQDLCVAGFVDVGDVLSAGENALGIRGVPLNQLVQHCCAVKIPSVTMS